MPLNKTELREKINNRALKTETVHIDDWDSDVFVLELTGRQFIKLSTECLVGSEIDSTELIDRAILISTFDLNKDRLFEDDELNVVKSLPADPYMKLVEAVTKVNNITGVSKTKN
jgi:hypothetical protein